MDKYSVTFANRQHSVQLHHFHTFPLTYTHLPYDTLDMLRGEILSSSKCQIDLYVIWMLQITHIDNIGSTLSYVAWFLVATVVNFRMK